MDLDSFGVGLGVVGETSGDEGVEAGEDRAEGYAIA